MEAKELMVGDWVKMRLPDNLYTETAQLDSIDAVLHGRLIVEPIPITPEILELNAKYDDIDNCYTIGCIQFFRQDEGEYWLDCYYGIITFKYVHELQHVLRICSLNDLADNLKIK